MCIEKGFIFPLDVTWAEFRKLNSLFLPEILHLRSFLFRVLEESSGVISEEPFVRQNAG